VTVKGDASVHRQVCRSLTTPRSQSHGRPCAVMCIRRITCADAVVKRAFDGSCWRSLLQSCYTVELGTGWFTDVSLRGHGRLGAELASPGQQCRDT
jgi:hypothetical protein